MRKPTVAALLAALATLATFCSSAHASTPEDAVAFTWEALPGCPTKRDVLAEIADALGRATIDRWVEARAVVTQAGDREWVVDLTTEIDKIPAHRAMRASSCAELASAVATVLALEISGEGAQSDRSSRPAASSDAENAHSDSERNGSAAPESTRRDRTTGFEGPPAIHDAKNAASVTRPISGVRGTRLAVDLDAVGATGIFSGAAYGVGGGVSWLPGRSRITVGAVYFPPVRVAGEASGTGGAFNLLAGSASGCHALIAGSFQVSPCAGIELGRLQASGGGAAVEVSSEGAAPWIAARAGSLAVWQIARWGLRLQADAVIPFIRNRFVIDGVGTVARPAAVGGRFTIGAEIHFP